MSNFNNNFNNNFFNPGYTYFEDESVFESDEPVAGPSRSQDWYLNPAAGGDCSGYQGWTLLDVSGNELTGPHASFLNDYGRFESCEPFCHRSLSLVLMIFLDQDVDGWYTHEETVNIPAVGVYPSVDGSAATHFQPPSAAPTPAVFNGPISPFPALPWQADIRKYSQHFRLRLDHSPVCLDNPLPTSPYAAGSLPPGAYDQPLAGPSSTSQWSDSLPTTSVDKGKARATDHTPPVSPAYAGNDGE